MQTPQPPLPQLAQGSKAPRRVYVIFTAEIVPHTTETLIQSLSNLSQVGVSQVYLAFSTPGGNVMNGIALYNFLRGVSFDLTIHNIGNVDSIGNAIFLSAPKERRFASRHSTFMFHGVGQDRPAGRYEAKLLREMMDNIESDQRRIGSVISERSDIPADEVDALFLEATTKTAEFAKERGIINEIREFQLPAGEPVVSFIFQRQGV